MAYEANMLNRNPTPETKEPMWNTDKIQAYFKRELPNEIQLDSVTKITNVRRFVDSHIAVLRNKETNPTYLPYYHRLLQLTKLL